MVRQNEYYTDMQIKVREFRLIVPELAGGGCDEDRQYAVSEDLLTIPEQMLNQQGVVVTLPNGVKGINECCSRIHVGGCNWLVLGDARSVCYTNDEVVLHY